MKTPTLLVMLSIPMLSVSVRGALEASAEANAPARATSQAPAKRAISKGMTAEQVLQLVGKPTEVKPMASPAGKAEVWIYRRVADKWTQQTAATTETVMMYAGLGLDNDGIRPVTVPSMRMERIKIYQVTSLLMFEGKLVEAKQRFEKERTID